MDTARDIRVSNSESDQLSKCTKKPENTAMYSHGILAFVATPTASPGGAVLVLPASLSPASATSGRGVGGRAGRRW